MKAKSGCIITACIVALHVVIFTAAAVGTYNGLIRRETVVDKNWSEIDNMLQRRADLIPNLVETVKGYAKHESEIFTRVAEARSQLLAARSVADKAQASSLLTGAVTKLLAVAENYPNLKADQSFIRLQDELAGTENRIAVARTRYNESAQVFNAKIRGFPGFLFAERMGLTQKPYFEVKDETARERPDVKF